MASSSKALTLSVFLIQFLLTVSFDIVLTILSFLLSPFDFHIWRTPVKHNQHSSTSITLHPLALLPLLRPITTGSIVMSNIRRRKTGAREMQRGAGGNEISITWWKDKQGKTNHLYTPLSTSLTYCFHAFHPMISFENHSCNYIILPLKYCWKTAVRENVLRRASLPSGDLIKLSWIASRKWKDNTRIGRKCLWIIYLVKGLVSRCIKNFLQINSKREINPKKANGLKRYSLKKIHDDH